MKPRIVYVSDSMQSDYSCDLVAPAGRKFAAEFTPELTPRAMLHLGVFGGKYMTDCRAEFPSSWFAGAKLCAEKHDPSLNFFGVNAASSLAEWRAKGWIHQDDPRGWFQWYCRYYLGRRHEDDERQIGRWKNMRRHISQVKNIADDTTWTVVPDSDRLCCTGPMALELSN
jgi:hypothetical protein